MDRGGAQARADRDVSGECILAELDAKANQKRSPGRSQSRTTAEVLKVSVKQRSSRGP